MLHAEVRISLPAVQFKTLVRLRYISHLQILHKSYLLLLFLLVEVTTVYRREFLSPLLGDLDVRFVLKFMYCPRSLSRIRLEFEVRDMSRTGFWVLLKVNNWFSKLRTVHYVNFFFHYLFYCNKMTGENTGTYYKMC